LLRGLSRFGPKSREEKSSIRGFLVNAHLETDGIEIVKIGCDSAGKEFAG